jgi:hypothetical protein
MNLDWQHVYLLGWHSANGMRNLTSWSGDRPWIDVIVVGATDDDMSHIMWSAPLHNDFKIISIPPLTNRLAYAKINNGLHAFGWYIEEGINRPPMRPLIDRWAWFNTLKNYKIREE